MPLGAKNMSMGIWNGILKKCEKKLPNWKSQYLSLCGRLFLIETVLDAFAYIYDVPIFYACQCC